VGLVRLGSRRLDRGKYIDSNPNLAFWLASLAIVIAAICFMLTKIELTDADDGKPAR
jgi:hypothetical protein